MSCKVLTQISINEQLILHPAKPSEKLPHLLKLSRKTLKNAAQAIQKHLTAPEQFPILFLDLGELSLSIQTTDSVLPTKSEVSKSVLNSFSFQNLNSPNELLTEIQNEAQFVKEFSEVLETISQPESINSVQTVLSRSKSLTRFLSEFEKKVKKTVASLKAKVFSGEQNSFVYKIKELKEEIEELSAAIGSTSNETEKNVIQMEIMRKTTRINELRSQNILSLSESRAKLYDKSLISSKLNHIRNISFVGMPKPAMPQNPSLISQDLLPILTDLESCLSQSHSLRTLLSDLN